MPTSQKAQITYEASQSLEPMAALSDTGDQIFFESGDELWSFRSGFVPVVRPDGVISGFAITPGTAADTIDIAKGKLYQGGVEYSVSAQTAVAVARPTLEFIKYSIEIDVSQAGDVVAGTEGGSFSDTRDAAGGPPYITADTAVEIGQVWLSSSTPGAVLASEIKQVPGSSIERFDTPTFNQKRLNVENGVSANAGVEFVSALPLSHTAGVPKGVYAEYHTPEFTEVQNSTDFVPAETTNSVTSIPVYNNTLGSVASTLNQSTFTVYPNDGITDPILQLIGENLFFKFKQDRLNDPYILQQGIFGVARTFPSDGAVAAAATVSTGEASVNVFE
jgi:hypothetical protein